jgi:HEAT repeat protein
MKTRLTKTSHFATAMLLALTLLSVADAQTGEDLVKQLCGQTLAPARDAAQLTEAYQKAIDYLIPLMSAQDVESRYPYEIMLQDMGSYAARPGAEAQRLAMATVCVKTLEQKAMESTVREWFVLQLERIGKDESVPLLTKLMSDDDKNLRDYARRALQKNPDPTATEALLKELSTAKDPAWRMGLISALGDRGTQEAVPPISKALSDSNLEVAQTAARALAQIGGAQSGQALFAVLDKPVGPPSVAAAQALIDMAGQMEVHGDAAGAAKIYSPIYDWTSKALAGSSGAIPVSIRTAAVAGMIVTDPERGPKEIVTLIQDPSPRVRAAVVQAARRSPSLDATQTLARLLPKLPSDSQVQVLGLIGDRKDVAAFEVVKGTLDSTDDAVCLASVDAMAQLGTDDAAKALFAVAVNGTGTPQKTAQKGLAAMGGPQAETLIETQAASGEPKARVVAIRLLGQRRTDGAAKTLLAYAAESDQAVRGAALAALVDVADTVDVAALTDLVAKIESESLRTKGVTALQAVLAKSKDRNAAAQVVVDRMKTTDGQTRLSLLSSLSAAGGSVALKAVLDATQSSDETTRDVAIRTLSEWPDYEAAQALLDIAAKPQTSLTHYVLATRGVLRLVGESEDVPLKDRATLCLKTLDQARRDDEKRLAIATLAMLPTDEAAQRLLELAKNENLKGEAGLAAVTLAGNMLWIDRLAARDLARKIRDLNISEDINERADAILDSRNMRRMGGFRGGFGGGFRRPR